MAGRGSGRAPGNDRTPWFILGSIFRVMPPRCFIMLSRSPDARPQPRPTRREGRWRLRLGDAPMESYGISTCATNVCRLGHICSVFCCHMALLAPIFSNGCRLGHICRVFCCYMALLAPITNNGCRLGHFAHGPCSQAAHLHRLRFRQDYPSTRSRRLPARGGVATPPGAEALAVTTGVHLRL